MIIIPLIGLVIGILITILRTHFIGQFEDWSAMLKTIAAVSLTIAIITSIFAGLSLGVVTGIIAGVAVFATAYVIEKLNQ